MILDLTEVPRRHLSSDDACKRYSLQNSTLDVSFFEYRTTYPQSDLCHNVRAGVIMTRDFHPKKHDGDYPSSINNNNDVLYQEM